MLFTYGGPALHLSAINPASNTSAPKTRRNDEVCGRLVSAEDGHSMKTESAMSTVPTICSSFHRRDKRRDIMTTCSSGDAAF